MPKIWKIYCSQEPYPTIVTFDSKASKRFSFLQLSNLYFDDVIVINTFSWGQERYSFCGKSGYLGKKVLILVLWVCLLWVGQVFNDNSFCLVSLEMSIRIALRTFWKIKLNFFLRTVIRKLYRRILSLRSLSLKIQIFQRAQGF